MRKEKLVFKYGEEIELPQDIIDDAPSQGAFDDYADYLVNRFDVRCSLKDSIKYLKRYGAWDLDELQDIELNVKRIFWTACLDCKENNTNYFYMGE